MLNINSLAQRVLPDGRKWQDFNDFRERPLLRIEQRVAPAIEHLRAGQFQHLVDQLVRGEAQIGPGPAGVGNFMFLQNMAEWKMLLENLLAGRLPKKLQMNFNRAKLHRLAGFIQSENDFTEIGFIPAATSEDLQMDAALVKLLERRRHVILVNEERLERF